MKPILFSTPMVQAILDGRKTQTRRVIKPQPIDVRWCIDSRNGDHYYDTVRGSDIWLNPRYQSGDILWVRETWCKLWKLNGNDQIIDGTEKYYYAADGYNPTPFNYFPDEFGFSNGRDCPRWKPSIHMPKEAARLFLRVINVRAERVQDITPSDCRAEGIAINANPPLQDDSKWYRERYSELWDNLNAKRGYGWDANPWVWVYEFERIEMNEL